MSLICRGERVSLATSSLRCATKEEASVKADAFDFRLIFASSFSSVYHSLRQRLQRDLIQCGSSFDITQRSLISRMTGMMSSSQSWQL